MPPWSGWKSYAFHTRIDFIEKELTANQRIQSDTEQPRSNTQRLYPECAERAKATQR